ncbi:MAG: hypothetical protein ACJAUD_001848, partial [Crocinitomicaceae bacterium]
MKMKNILFTGALVMTSSLSIAQPIGDTDGKVNALQLNTITTALPFM